MIETQTEEVIQKMGEAFEQYHRLILVVGPSESGKTSVLQEVQKQKGVPLVNVNLELSRSMLELTARQRVLQIQQLLSEIVNSSSSNTILLDNVEMLFDVHLKQDPLRLFQGISRNKTVVVALNGTIQGGHIIYATPDHPEYKRYPLGDFLLIDMVAKG